MKICRSGMKDSPEDNLENNHKQKKSRVAWKSISVVKRLWNLAFMLLLSTVEKVLASKYFHRRKLQKPSKITIILKLT